MMLSSDYHQMSRGISQGNQAILKLHLIDSGKACVHTLTCVSTVVSVPPGFCPFFFSLSVFQT